VPIFSITAASITEPATGASTCASGSQVCRGKMGTLDGEGREKRQEEQQLLAGANEACRSRSCPQGPGS